MSDVGPKCGAEDLPAEVWGLICARLTTADLVQLIGSCWLLRHHALATVTSHIVSPLGGSGQTRQRRMARALRWLSIHCHRLRSIDLTAWNTLSSGVLRELPRTMFSLGLSYSSTTSKGIDALPFTLQALDLRYANISRRALKHLVHLTNLRTLNLSHVDSVRTSSLRYIPDSVEELDLSYCPSLEFEKPKNEVSPDSAFSMAQAWQYLAYDVKWPSSIRVLQLDGLQSASAALFSLPPTVRVLNLSHTVFRAPRLDFTKHLPNLETFVAEATRFNVTFERLWALPDGLKTLSLRSSSVDASNLLYLPTSITSLDLAHTLVTEYCSLYETEKINFFFKDLSRCMPNLRYLDLRCGYPYGSEKYGPCLRGKVETLLLDNPLSEDTEDTIPELNNCERWKPREESEQWKEYMNLCAVSRDSVRLEPVDKDVDGDCPLSDEDDVDLSTILVA